jgi:hypothetical protein
MMRWFAVRETRVDDPANYRYAGGRFESLAPDESTLATMNNL